MKRILIIGCPGSGKSTLSIKLHEITGLPLIHLDLILHRDDGTELNHDEFDVELDQVLKQDEWIIDGHYHRTLSKRIEYCDTILFFDLPVDVCLSNVENRLGHKVGDQDWIDQSYSQEFMDYIRDFHYDQLPKTYELLSHCHDKSIHIFHSYDDVNIFLSKTSSV